MPDLFFNSQSTRSLASFELTMAPGLSKKDRSRVLALDLHKKSLESFASNILCDSSSTPEPLPHLCSASSRKEGPKAKKAQRKQNGAKKPKAKKVQGKHPARGVNKELVPAKRDVRLTAVNANPECSTSNGRRLAPRSGTSSPRWGAKISLRSSLE